MFSPIRASSAALLTALALPLPASAATTSEEGKRAPAGYAEMEVIGVVPHPDGNTVLLTDEEQELVLPIGIGNSEALSIHLRLAKQRFERPLTHDLLDEVIDKLGGDVVKAQIDRVDDGVFYARVTLRTDKGLLSIDARPSDAIALSLGGGAPLFVARSVLQEAGIRPSDLVPGASDKGPAGPPILDL